MKHVRFAAAVIAALLPALAMAQVYRWVDKDGKVHYSDTPPNEDAKVTQQRTPSGGGDDTTLPYGLQMAMKSNPVTLYVGNSCGEFCANGRQLLAKRGVPYRERNAEMNRSDADALTEAAGSLTVPTLTVGTQVLTGYTEDAWNSALDSAGYPRTKLPGLKLPSPTPPPAPPRTPPPKQPPAETKAPQ